jgi:hypothetical protein
MKIRYDDEEEIFNCFLEALQKKAIQVDNIDIARIWIKERIIYKWTWQFDSYRNWTK